jgi:hypothetical protein
MGFHALILTRYNLAEGLFATKQVMPAAKQSADRDQDMDGEKSKEHPDSKVAFPFQP